MNHDGHFLSFNLILTRVLCYCLSLLHRSVTGLFNSSVTEWNYRIYLTPTSQHTLHWPYEAHIVLQALSKVFRKTWSMTAGIHTKVIKILCKNDNWKWKGTESLAYVMEGRVRPFGMFFHSYHTHCVKLTSVKVMNTELLTPWPIYAQTPEQRWIL
jgi:hypothetical protein